ncbi:MAG: hypothetical protein R3A13_00070 [Bdellovibrionota bacterium]
MKIKVIDASVAVKWFLIEKEGQRGSTRSFRRTSKFTKEFCSSRVILL